MIRHPGVIAMLVLGLAGFSCSRSPGPSGPVPEPPAAPEVSGQADQPDDQGRATVVLAGGCFWCVEAVYEQLEGVLDVESGYAGGEAGTANYRAVSSGGTDHAEVVRITYDPSKISYGELLKVFFTVAHDPTQVNRQGPDVGRQYRSAIFYADEVQKHQAEAYIRKLEEAGTFDRPIATTLEPLEQFHPAEAYHQDYVQKNPSQPYVQAQALPKVRKLREAYPQRVQSPGE
jgi:peptide-methionine (S)-S-oxide reductase